MPLSLRLFFLTDRRGWGLIKSENKEEGSDTHDPYHFWEHRDRH